MSGRIYLYVDVAEGADGIPGCGWVASSEDVAAYGSASGPIPHIIEQAFAFAMNRFPGADEILVGSNRTEVLGIPWGRAAEDPGIVAFDATGVARSCAGRGVTLAIRWLPTDSPGSRACLFMAGVARALSHEAARGDHPIGEIALGQGWRTRILSIIGGSALNHVLADRGLGRTASAAFIGITPDAVAEAVRDGVLVLGPQALVIYATAIRLRDALEAEGAVAWGPEDHGHAEFDDLLRPADATLFVSDYDGPKSAGVGLVLSRGTKLIGWGRRYGAQEETRRQDCVRVSLLAMAEKLKEFKAAQVLAVPTTDGWLAKVLAGSKTGATPGILKAMAALREVAADSGIEIRPSHLKIPFSRSEAPGDLEALARSSALLAGAARVGEVDAIKARPALELMAACEDRVAALRAARSRQSEVSERILRACGVDEDAIAAFEGLVAETARTYRGLSVELQPILPWPVNGHLAMLDGTGVRVMVASYGMAPGLGAAWAAWHGRYGGLRAGNPVLRLMEMVVRAEGLAGPGGNPGRKYNGILAWIQGLQTVSPFAFRPGTRRRGEREMLRVVAECGGWPFAPPGRAKPVLDRAQRAAPPERDPRRDDAGNGEGAAAEPAVRGAAP